MSVGTSHLYLASALAVAMLLGLPAACESSVDDAGTSGTSNGSGVGGIFSNGNGGSDGSGGAFVNECAELVTEWVSFEAYPILDCFPAAGAGAGGESMTSASAAAGPSAGPTTNSTGGPNTCCQLNTRDCANCLSIHHSSGRAFGKAFLTYCACTNECEEACSAECGSGIGPGASCRACLCEAAMDPNSVCAESFLKECAVRPDCKKFAYLLRTCPLN
ncbi:hypothetical protein JYT22_00080 [Endomicrobium sp. AH-315-J14]|nr:hypothetical protein [Endomicrobium sp. AH-315-J14]